MKKIYIVLTHTGTTLSKIIKTYTKDEFSHVSIALDNKLQEMYSFGRLHPYNPLFVHEYIDKGTYKRFYKTMARVYSYEVTEEQYEKLKNNIKQIEANKEDYKFNIVGLVAVGFHKKIGKEKSFYCAEFVKYVIEKANIDMNLPTIIKPEDWSFGLSDDILEAHAEKWAETNEVLREECPKYGIEFIDTSENRKEILNQILLELSKDKGEESE